MFSHVISNFSLFFFSFFFLFLSNTSRIFSPKDMKLQAAVIFSSLQNAKFTSIAGYTSCRPTNIESFMTVFGQCINVLNYKYIYMKMSCSCLTTAQQSLNDVRQTKEDDGNACGTISCKPIGAW